jgi:hypothetical protein
LAGHVVGAVCWSGWRLPRGLALNAGRFFIGLKRVGGDDGPWKVYYWAPNYRPAVPDTG